METLTRQKRKKNKTHTSIMHSAKALFEQKGIGNVTVEEISEKADISRSTFFTHFQSIDDLLLELANQEIEDLLEVVKKENRTGISNIELLFYKLLDDIYNYPSLSMFLLTNNILSNKNQSCKPLVEIIKKDLIDSNVNQSEFSINEACGLLLGTVFGPLYQKFIEGTPFNDINEQKKTITKILTLLK